LPTDIPVTSAQICRLIHEEEALNPLKNIIDDRTEARKQGDTNADCCFLALADQNGQASVRTLVLREITDSHLVLFLNRTSPKWQLLQHGANYELLLWYASMQRQYRIQGKMQPLDSKIVKQTWQRRPHGSKYLDYVYQEMAPQSSVIDSREQLVSEIERLKKTYNIDDMQAPDDVGGIALIADRVEMLDLNREDRIHDRRVFSLNDGLWTSRVLVP
jgi:pyridoxamine 5'-phosphate oxidase